MDIRKILSSAGWVLSPTRKIIDLLKVGDPIHRGDMLRKWSLLLFVVEVLGLIVLGSIFREAPARHVDVFSVLAIAYGFSRVNEIAYAFYRDSLDEERNSDLSATERVRMAMRSYYGAAFNFALLYYFVQVSMTFNTELSSFFEAFYFSGVTAATLGYGDIYPRSLAARVFSLYEVALGLLLLAVAIATYAGSARRLDR